MNDSRAEVKSQNGKVDYRLGSLDAFRILFRQPVRLAKSAFAQSRFVLENSFVADGFRLCLVCAESADFIIGAKVSV